MGVALALIPLVVGLLAAFVAYGRWRLAPLGGRARPRRPGRPARAELPPSSDSLDAPRRNPRGLFRGERAGMLSKLSKRNDCILTGAARPLSDHITGSTES